MNRKNDKVLENIAQMEPVEGSQSAKQIQARLTDGRKRFNQLVGDVCSSVMKISALELTMEDSTDKMVHISSSVQQISDAVVHTSRETEENMDEVVGAHEGFTDSIM